MINVMDGGLVYKVKRVFLSHPGLAKAPSLKNGPEMFFEYRSSSIYYKTFKWLFKAFILNCKSRACIGI
jgi:hypothetical protein